MKKRYFILFEILIALFLISICAAFVISNPIYFYKKEIRELEELELKLLEYEVFCKIKKKLIRNKISIKNLAKTKEEARCLKLKDGRIMVDGFLNKTIPVYFLMWGKVKKGINNEKCVKLKVQISLKDAFRKRGKKYFTYILFVKQVDKSKKKYV